MVVSVDEAMLASARTLHRAERRAEEPALPSPTVPHQRPATPAQPGTVTNTRGPHGFLGTHGENGEHRPHATDGSGSVRGAGGVTGVPHATAPD